jgi:hypothetical protein
MISAVRCGGAARGSTPASGVTGNDGDGLGGTIGVYAGCRGDGICGVGEYGMNGEGGNDEAAKDSEMSGRRAVDAADAAPGVSVVAIRLWGSRPAPPPSYET